MAIQRVALIFDSVLRPETAGVYCHRASSDSSRSSISSPRVDRIPRKSFDLYLNIDDGLRYRLPPELRPAPAGPSTPTSTSTAAARRLRVSTSSSPPSATGRTCCADRRRRVLAAAGLRPRDPPQARRGQAVRRRLRRQRLPRAARDLLALDPAAVSQLVYRPALLRGDGPDLLGGPHRVQPQHPQRRQHAGLRGASACGSLLLTNDLGDNGQAELFRDGVHLATYREPRRPARQAGVLSRPRGDPRTNRRGRPRRSDREAHLRPSDGDGAAGCGVGVVADRGSDLEVLYVGSTLVSDHAARDRRLPAQPSPRFGARLPTKPHPGPQVSPHAPTATPKHVPTRSTSGMPGPR